MEKKEDYGILHFLHIAHNEYVTSVINGDFTYYRFYNDFVNGHRFPMEDEDENAHERIMLSLKDLFEKRQSLVEHFFKRDALSDQDFCELKKAHESTMPGKHPIEVMIKRGEIMEIAKQNIDNELSDISHDLNDKQLAAVAEWLNQEEDGEAYLYNCELSETDVQMLFAGKLPLTIGKGMNCKLLLKFDALAHKRVIDNGWRKFFQDHQSLHTFGYKRSMNSNNMSRNITNGRKQYDYLVKRFNAKAKQIKDLGQ